MGLYLEITKGKGSPAEGVSLRERQSRAVKCSVVRGEPVDQQVRGHRCCDHDRSFQSTKETPPPPKPSEEPNAWATLFQQLLL